MSVNNLLKVITWKRSWWDSNPQPLSHSLVWGLTTTPPIHYKLYFSMKIVCLSDWLARVHNRLSQMYMGPNFLTQPNIQQTQPNLTHEYLGRTDPTRPVPKAVLPLSINYFKCRLVFSMHVKIKTNMRHKSKNSMNIKLSSVTRGSSSHLASSLD